MEIFEAPGQKYLGHLDEDYEIIHVPLDEVRFKEISEAIEQGLHGHELRLKFNQSELDTYFDQINDFKIEVTDAA